jgi:pyruvate/2-oxoglutarate/acetoin dehydrogenase E1 component
MNYRDNLRAAMNEIAKCPRAIFLGQSIRYGGNEISKTLADIAEDRKIELPLIEDTQMGIAIGLSLQGYLPISVYPRFDFFMLSINQLVNHLDKIYSMSKGKANPKVIIRVAVGSKFPINAGAQHTQDHSKTFRRMLSNVDLVNLRDSSNIIKEYLSAINSARSTILVEYYEKYNRE